MLHYSRRLIHEVPISTTSIIPDDSFRSPLILAQKLRRAVPVTGQRQRSLFLTVDGGNRSDACRRTIRCSANNLSGCNRRWDLSRVLLTDTHENAHGHHRRNGNQHGKPLQLFFPQQPSPTKHDQNRLKKQHRSDQSPTGNSVSNFSIENFGNRFPILRWFQLRNKKPACQRLQRRRYFRFGQPAPCVQRREKNFSLPNTLPKCSRPAINFTHNFTTINNHAPHGHGIVKAHFGEFIFRRRMLRSHTNFVVIQFDIIDHAVAHGIPKQLPC